MYQVGDFFRLSGKVYQIKEQLHSRLFLVEEYDEGKDDLYATGRETYVTAWELERYSERV